MQNPRWTLVTLEYPPEHGGIARYVGNLVAASGGEMHVIVEQGRDLTGPGCVTERVFFWSRWPKWLPLVNVCRDCAGPGAVLLVSHVLPVGTAAWMARFIGGPEYVVLFHGTDIRRVRSRWKRWLVRRICGGAKGLVANSERTKRELCDMIGEREVIVVTPGVEAREILARHVARTHVGLAETAQIVVSVARLVPRKGIDQAIRAMGEIQKETDVMYVVIGDGPDIDRLRIVAEDAKASVIWKVGITDEEKWAWLCAADVFLLPGRDEGTDVEGFGIVFLEAGKAGLPCVAGRSGGVEEAVVNGETGILVEPRSVHDIVRAVKGLLTNEVLRRTLGEKGRARVEAKFGWPERWKMLRERMTREG